MILILRTVIKRRHFVRFGIKPPNRTRKHLKITKMLFVILNKMFLVSVNSIKMLDFFKRVYSVHRLINYLSRFDG